MIKWRPFWKSRWRPSATTGILPSKLFLFFGTYLRYLDRCVALIIWNPTGFHSPPDPKLKLAVKMAAIIIVALENISYTVWYSLQTYMNMVVILVAIVGFGVIKTEWYHNYITATTPLFLSWKVDGGQCAFTDKHNTILLWASFEYWHHIYFESPCGNNIIPRENQNASFCFHHWHCKLCG